MNQRHAQPSCLATSFLPESTHRNQEQSVGATSQYLNGDVTTAQLFAFWKILSRATGQKNVKGSGHDLPCLVGELCTLVEPTRIPTIWFTYLGKICRIWQIIACLSWSTKLKAISLGCLLKGTTCNHGPLVRYVQCGLRMRRGYRERFTRHRLQRKPIVSNPACITARASRTCRDACRDR